MLLRAGRAPDPTRLRPDEPPERGLHARILARHAADLERHPWMLTPEESLARALALGALWSTAVLAAARLVHPIPWWAAVLPPAYPRAQGSVACCVYRASRRGLISAIWVAPAWRHESCFGEEIRPKRLLRTASPSPQRFHALGTRFLVGPGP